MFNHGHLEFNGQVSQDFVLSIIRERPSLHAQGIVCCYIFIWPMLGF